MTCSQEYMPCDPSGLKITMIQVENPAISAIAARDWWLCQWVRSSTTLQPSVSNARVSSNSLAAGLTRVPWAERAQGFVDTW